MKIKTFILTFLMMMSSPFLFGQSHWDDPALGYESDMRITAKIFLDESIVSEGYQLAAFSGDELLDVVTILEVNFGGNTLWHADMDVPGNSGMKIYFKLFDGDKEKEYVSETKFDFDEDAEYTHAYPAEINFKSVAQIEGTEYDVVYSSLQEAINAAKNNDEIALLQNNAENVTVVQAPDVAFTINGAEKTMTGTITVNGKSAAYPTAGLTIKNVNFDATNIAKDASIMLGVSGDDNTRYTNGVTVQDCNFTGNGQTKAAIKNYTGGCKNIAVSGGTFTGLHSLMQVKGVNGIEVSGVTVENCKNGIAVGTSTNVAISGSTISATGYGVRADGEGAYTMTLTDNTISAELPVVVRYAKAAYNLTIGEGNTLTANQQGNNPDGYQVVFTNGDDGTYEAPTGIFSLTVAEGTNLNVYPVYVAELNGKKYITFDEAYKDAQNGDVINLLRTVVLDDSKMWWNYSSKQITVEAREINPAFRVQSGGAMVNFGSMTINSYDGYCIIVGSSDGSIDANVSIYGGTYNGETSAISVTKGNVTIENGTFKVEPYQGSYEYTINCYDPSYKNGTADVSIKGGKFYNFNPQNNAAEGAGTDFLTAGYAAVQDADGYWNVVKAVAMIEHEDSKDKYYATLPDAVAAAKDGETVTLIKDATGAGLVINKNVTVDFGGKTYTINQAVGSTGTESQGFQILKEATEVTLTNGNIAVAEGTNVVWMINDYSAKLNVTDLTFDCENMKWEKAPNVYFLVANNAHKQNPAVTLEGVTVNNFNAEAGSPYYMEPETTIASSDANLDIEVDPGYVVEYENGVYSVVAGNVLNSKTGKKYATLQAAIDEASANDLIVLLENITEDVTVDKSLTIDGKAADAEANSEYTGNIKISGNVNVTINEVAFVKGYVEHTSSNNTGTITVKYCSFANGGYAITTSRIKSVTIENCEVTSQSLLYAKLSTSDIVVKNVNISKGNYVAHIVYGSTAYFENVNATEMTGYGIYTQNYGAKTITINNCKFETPNYNSISVRDDRTEAIDTFIFKGTNEMTSLKDTDKANYVLAEVEATLAAPEGLTVTTTVEGCVVEYEEGETEGFGTYSVIPGNVELVRNEESVGKFATIQDAIDAAENGDKIVVLEDLTVGYEDAKSTFGGNYKTFFNVSGKTVTIDLNGKTVKAVLEGEETVYAMFSVENNGVLNVEDNTNDGHAIIESESAVYSLFTCYTDGKLNINSGNFRLNRGYDDNSGSGGMIYSQEDETVIVNGGKFILDNVGTSLNGSPWIFNAKGNNEQNIEVHGGTYNYNVFNQYRIFEVQTTKEYAIKYNGDEAGTWTVVPAVAWVNNQEKSGNWYTYELGYVTLAEAFAAAEDCNRPDFAETVTLLQNITLAESITVNADQEVVLDLNGFTVSQEKECTKHYEMIRNNGTLTIKDSTEEARGKISFMDTGAGDPNFGWGSYTIGNYGTLVVENGTIENISTQNPGNGQPNVHTYCAIQQGHGAVSTTINGGTISNQTYRSIRTNTGALVINGGNIIGQVWVQPNQGNATLEITDGEFDPTGNDGSSVFMTNEGENYTVTSASITGGFFKTKIGATDPTKEGVAGCVTGGTFTTAAKDNTNAALINENFAFVDNGNNTWTVMPTQEQHLVAGWNWYSTYLDIELNDLTNALGDNGIQIKNQDEGSLDYYNYQGQTGWTGSLSQIDNSKMYMIKTNGVCDLKMAASVVNAADCKVTLKDGWTWIGYPSNVAVDINEAFEGLQPAEGDVIKTQNNGSADYAYGQWWGSLNTMVPGIGYQYRNKSGEVREFVYNIPNSKSETRANITTENNYWVANATLYPHTMTMTAVIDGEWNNPNYEVAAFVNGELRGSARPIYVEPMDAYMFFLTIHGEDVEEVSFRLYDIDTDTEYALSDRINYSNNAHLGSVKEPYAFTRGTTGIGEAAMSNVNIYPNPTTTGTEINLQAVCDTVEVFNALGVKVAEYQNVDSIDALETAGIYVIRITNDGNVQNCRLVVK